MGMGMGGQILGHRARPVATGAADQCGIHCSHGIAEFAGSKGPVLLWEKPTDNRCIDASLFSR